MYGNYSQSTLTLISIYGKTGSSPGGGRVEDGTGAGAQDRGSSQV
jgi:hypothetical protein